MPIFFVEVDMLTKRKIIELLREKYPYLVREYNVKQIGLFGSYARGLASEASDIDVIVEFESAIGFKFMEFGEYLERLFGQKVDILTLAGLRAMRISRVAKDIRESIIYV